MTLNLSRRQWDGLIKNWKRCIHKYDPEAKVEKEGQDQDQDQEDKGNSSTLSWAEEVELQDEEGEKCNITTQLPHKIPPVITCHDDEQTHKGCSNYFKLSVAFTTALLSIYLTWIFAL